MIQINLAHDAPEITAARIPVAELMPARSAAADAAATGPFVYELQLGDDLTLLLDEWQAADLVNALQQSGLTV